jgi:hypothetical protein
MRLKDVPPFVKDKQIEVGRLVRRYGAAAIEAEREAERLRLIANNSHAPTEEHRQAKERFPAALQHAKEVRALAAAEQKVFDSIEKLLEEASDSAKFEKVEVDTSGYTLESAYAKLKEIDAQLHAIATAFTPHSRAEIELYVAVLGRAFERGIKFQGDKMIFPVDVFNETEPDWWKKECSLHPAAVIEWYLRVEAERAAHPYPASERPAAVARLNEEKATLQYVIAKLVDTTRDGDRGPQVMQTMPGLCVLRARIILPEAKEARAA